MVGGIEVVHGCLFCVLFVFFLFADLLWFGIVLRQIQGPFVTATQGSEQRQYTADSNKASDHAGLRNKWRRNYTLPGTRVSAAGQRIASASRCSSCCFRRSSSTSEQGPLGSPSALITPVR